MKYKDYYDILGLETNRVNIDEIKTAYRLAAKKYHPDLNVGDNQAEEKIKDINEAYKILSTPALKRKYDRTWMIKSNIKNYKQIRGKNIFNMFLGNVKDEPEENIKRLKTPTKGEDIKTEISVSLEEAFFGVEKKISLRSLDGKMKTLLVKIPEGIKRGEKVRLLGQGKKGTFGGKNGDLFIKIDIQNSNVFKLKGSDLYTDLKLTPWEAALGTRVDVKTIDGKTSVYIPQGIQSGEKLKIANKGYKKGNGVRGDLVAEIKVVVPKNMSNEEREIYEKLKQISNFNPRNS